MRRLLGYVLLFVIAAAIALGLRVLSVPVPELFGGFVAVLLFSMRAGGAPNIPRAVMPPAQAVLGTTVAAQIHVEMLRGLAGQLPVILVAALLILLGSWGIGQLLRLRGASPTTAALSALAGGASSLTVVADELGADQRVVMMVQFLRVTLILVTMPLVVLWVSGAAPGSAPGWQEHPVDYLFVLCTVIAALVISRFMRIAAAPLIAAIVIGALLVATPLFSSADVPAVVEAGALLLFGLHVGRGFSREAWRMLARIIPLALVSSLILVLFCAGIAVPFSMLTGASALDSYLAMSPGGLPVALATVVSTSGDAALVSTSQLMRVLIAVIVVPLLLQLLHRGRGRPTSGG